MTPLNRLVVHPVVRLVAKALVLVTGAMLLVATAWLYGYHRPNRNVGGDSPQQTVDLAPPHLAAQIDQLPAAGLVAPISPDEALAENSSRPFDRRPDTPASPFVLAPGTGDYERALNCLAQAVYYEAGSEPVDGQRAVAQIVLNRVRHPGYPASICGAIYQGSDRLTGCQFTFTCDGSIARAPVPALWRRAEQVARDALAGKVFAPVGHATHYHADFVVPYWSASLDKQLQIGHHIFYRLKGGLGAALVFNQRYSGQESESETASAVAQALDSSETLDAVLGAGATAVLGDGDAVASPPRDLLKADREQGKLAIDADETRGRLADGPRLGCQASTAATADDGDGQLVGGC